MAIDLPMVSTAELNCHRCGTCCQLIPLKSSPRDIRRFVRQNRLERRDALVLTKLECLGWTPIASLQAANGERAKNRAEGCYVYTNCPYHSFVDGLSTCRLHATGLKSWMCALYPCYERDGMKCLTNPVLFKGCGYNKDEDAGMTLEAQMENVRSLWKGER